MIELNVKITSENYDVLEDALKLYLDDCIEKDYKYIAVATMELLRDFGFNEAEDER